MKKAFSVLGAFCFGAFITIGVMACADDFSGYTPSTQSNSEATVVEIKRTYDGSVYFDYEFIYDENSRIVQVKYEDYYKYDSFDVTYSNNVITISTEGDTTTIKFAKDIELYPVGVVNEYIIREF